MSCLFNGLKPMLVCSCNFITEKEIRDTITDFLEQDCWQLIVPAKVYHAMEKRGRCCGCFPNVVDIIVSTTQAFHAQRNSDGENLVNFMERLKRFQEEQKNELIERRNRVSRTA
ncbi:(2Fe-2S)-binding protein [Agrobacterium vitis]|nr:(2Fe-2S)-binding protein [Agrobacterium vitis]MCE6076190.1 (2Fe-2S)-binding protein [Agrobacterium vitis]MUO69751.1 (2Fe-2S)-binding protein [Agrobacterium vitis]MUO82966.1 (2Fe-2S)-binding protein [Agrobacterium vitis]MVA36643.1 (2Fe-2S)-binding protein [Agrobacterium vitis]MVA80070.1 (2Fe-2S)-binding protein [Agrobacterium vitis]